MLYIKFSLILCRLEPSRITYSSDFMKFFIVFCFFICCFISAGNLERNQHITLAHVNPECYTYLDPQEQKAESNVHCSMWFIGLEFAKSENLNVDLTYDIHSFTETVNRQAINIKMLKEGMKIEARHVKRKQLNQYLSPSLLKRERKNSINSSVKNGTDSRKRLSDSQLDSYNKRTKIPDEINSQVCENNESNLCVTFIHMVL